MILGTLNDGARGFPQVKDKWIPSCRSGIRRERVTALSKSSPPAMMEVWVTIPFSWASIIPSVTPGVKPKSSAVTRSLRLEVKATFFLKGYDLA
jgi:hypothetical protein